MAIPGGCLDRLVAEGRLHECDWRTVLLGMGRVSMAHPVRTHFAFDIGMPGRLKDNAMDHALVHAAALLALP